MTYKDYEAAHIRSLGTVNRLPSFIDVTLSAIRGKGEVKREEVVDVVARTTGIDKEEVDANIQGTLDFLMKKAYIRRTRRAYYEEVL